MSLGSRAPLSSVLNQNSLFAHRRSEPPFPVARRPPPSFTLVAAEENPEPLACGSQSCPASWVNSARGSFSLANYNGQAMRSIWSESDNACETPFCIPDGDGL